jgi:hypothetical protein
MGILVLSGYICVHLFFLSAALAVATFDEQF